MKKSITNCPPGTKSTLTTGLRMMLVMLMFFGMSQYTSAQTPACNILGNLQGCAINDPADTRNDIAVAIEIAQSGHNPSLTYNIPANGAGAFIRNAALNDTVYNPLFNSLTDTIYIFPGTNSGGFLIELSVTNNESGQTNSCSKSVTVFKVTVDATYAPITCFGGTTTLNVTGISSPVAPMTFTLFPGGTVVVDNTNPYTAAYNNITGSVAGKSYTIMASNAFGCEAMVEKTITEPEYNPVTVTCPEEVTEASCQSQAAINAKFQAWLEGFTFTGGTNPTGTFTPSSAVAPDYCGGSVTVKYAVYGTCPDEADSCSSTFTVSDATDVVFTCGEDVTVQACSSQAAINAAYAAFLASTTASGGCNGELTNDGAGKAPSACGGSVDVTWTYTSDCEDDHTCTRTFTVTAAPEVVFNCGQDVTIQACSTQAQIDAAYAAFLASTTASGGCNGELTNDGAGKAPSACGGSVDVTWTYTSDCEDDHTCTRTFTVTAAPEVVFTCGEDVTIQACSSQAAINAAYAAFLASTTASGGCSGELTNDGAGKAPSACGGSVDVTWTYDAGCGQPQTCTRTFTVNSSEVSFTCGQDVTIQACSTQAQIDAAYAAFLASTTASGGCNGELTNDGAGKAPSACGGSVDVTWTYTSDCDEDYTCTRTFTVNSSEVSFTCGQDVTVQACSTQAQIDAAYAAFLASTTASGGCNGELTNDGAGKTPSYCGGSVDVTWTYTSDCEEDYTCTRTFTVTPAPELDAQCPGNVTLEACLSSSAIIEAYNAWKAGFKVVGGCNPSSNIGEIPSLPQNFACGAEISFNLIASNADGSCPGRDECSSTFKVNTGVGIQIGLTCVADKNILCTDEFTFDEPTSSGGCGTVTVRVKSTSSPVTNPDGTTSVTRTWEATDACGNKAECSQKVTKTCCSSIGDFVWEDTNKDGIQDAGEPGVQNVTVTLYRCGSNTEVASTSTNSSGYYKFENLCAGDYYVKFGGLPTGYNFGTKDAGSDDCKDSDADQTTGETACITLAEGEDNECVDAGLTPPAEYWGCTPGFWKNHPAGWDQTSDAISACINAASLGLGYGGGGTTFSLVRNIFGVTSAQMTAVGLNPNLTLIQAASLGGGGFQKLMRHGAASLLNSCGISANFPYSAQAVITDIHNAIVNKVAEPLASMFAGANEQEPNNCPSIPNKNKMDRTSYDESGFPEAIENVKLIVFPNPSNSVVNLNMIFNEEKERVVLEIYNVTGQKIAEIFNGSVESNLEYNVKFNVSSLPSGAYFYRLVAGDDTQMGKLSVVR